METITQDQFNHLLNGQIPLTLKDHIISDIQHVKTILLTQEDNNYYIDYIEVDMLCAEELEEAKQHGTLITIS